MEAMPWRTDPWQRQLLSKERMGESIEMLWWWQSYYYSQQGASSSDEIHGLVEPRWKREMNPLGDGIGRKIPET